MKGLLEEFFKWKSASVGMFLNNSRAQGAIEYLLIIGAAILVVAIVIIAITSVLSQGQNQTSSGAESANESIDQLKETSGAYYRINNYYYLKSSLIGAGVVGIYHFDGDAKDSSGNGNDLVCNLGSSVDCPVLLSGKFGNGYKFENKSYFYKNNPSWDFRGNPTKDYSLSAWFYGTCQDYDGISFGGTTNMRMDVCNRDCGDIPRWIFQLRAAETLAGNQTAVETCKLNLWQHVVGTYSASDRNISIYVDGKLTGSAIIPLTGLNTSSFSNIFSVGNAQEIFKNGLIDEVVVWDKALSAEDVNLLYANSFSN